MDTARHTETGPPLILWAETAADLMMANPVSVRAAATVEEATAFLTNKGFSAAPVIDEAGRPIGVVSRTDIVIHARELPVAVPAAHPTAGARERAGRPAGTGGRGVGSVDQTRVRDIMSPGVLSVSPETAAAKVVEDMVARNVHRLFVIDEDGILVGVISPLDVLRYLRPEPPGPAPAARANPPRVQGYEPW
jgi:CBS-domain-containing membrane protein